METVGNNKRNSSKRGRPVKEKKKLTCSINLKLTEDDFNAVKEKAAALGMKTTQYARQMTLKGNVKSRFTLEELALMRNLSGMANNLNQVARKANQGGFRWVETDAISIIKKLKELLYGR